MKIIYIGHYNSEEILTGPEKFAKRLYQNSLAAQDDFLFVDYFRGKSFSIWTKLFGSKRYYDSNLEVKRLGFLSTFFFLLKYKPDVIHLVTFEFFQIVTFLLKLFMNVKIIYTVHGVIFYENANFREKHGLYFSIKDKLYEKMIYRFSDKIVFVSNSVKELAFKYFDKINSKDLEVIPNGVDHIFFEVGKDSKAYNNKLNILFVGNITRREKGFDFFYKTVSQFNLPFKVFCISKGGKNIENEKHLLKTINFVEPMNTHEYAMFLKKIDVFISTSFYEPFQIVLIETMAAGITPIATKETGASYLIDNNRNGYIVNYGDFDSLLGYLVELNTKRDLLREFSNRAIDSVSGMTWQRVFNSYYRAYFD